MPIMTLAAVGTTVSVLNGTFTLGKQFYELRAAPGEWRESVKRLATVQHDLAYALKLRDRKFPDKINPGLGDNETFCQVQAAIKALASALLGCEKTLKAVDGPTKKARHRDDDGEEGSSSSSARVVDRFVWVFGGKSEFKDNYAALLLPHVTLSRWITVLENLPDVFEEEEAPPPYDGHGASFDESFLSPKQKQLRRGRSVELRGGEDEQDSRSTRKALSGINRGRSLPPEDKPHKSSRRSQKRKQQPEPLDRTDQQDSFTGDEFDRIFIEREKRRRQGS